MVVQLRVEDRLQGAQNFPTWKERITRILDVSDAEEHIDSTKVAPTNSEDLVAWKKIDSRAMLIILDGVKDHIVPHLSGKKTTLEMWKALESLYQSKNETGRWCCKIGCTVPRWPRVKEWCLILQGSHGSEMSLELLSLRQRMRS